MKQPTSRNEYTTISQMSTTTGSVFDSTTLYTTMPAVTTQNTTTNAKVSPT